MPNDGWSWYEINIYNKKNEIRKNKKIVKESSLSSSNHRFSFHLPFLHFFWIVLVGIQPSSPFFNDKVRVLILVSALHSVHGLFSYRQDATHEYTWKECEKMEQKGRKKNLKNMKNNKFKWNLNACLFMLISIIFLLFLLLFVVAIFHSSSHIFKEMDFIQQKKEKKILSFH